MNLEDHIEAERRLISALLWSPEAVVDMDEKFMLSKNYAIAFTVIRDQFLNGEQSDIISGCVNAGMPVMEASQLLEISEGGNPASWCRIVKSNWMQRKTAEAVFKSQELPDGYDALYALREDLEGIEREAVQQVEDGDSHTKFVESIETENRMVKTHLPSLDKFTGGWETGEFSIIAARPSVGKTAFGCTLGYNTARYGNVPTDYHTLEMEDYKVRRRVIANMAGVSVRKMKLSKYLTPIEKTRCIDASEQLKKYPLRFVSSAGKNIDVLCREILASKSDIILLDYLGCIVPTRTGSKNEEIGDISNKLRSVAKKTGKVIVALVQMNRAVEKADREPMLSDLRDSGEIEQDADQVWFLHEPDREKNIQREIVDVEMKIIVRKGRDGEVGYKRINFYKPYSRFYERDAEHVYDGPKEPDPSEIF